VLNPFIVFRFAVYQNLCYLPRNN